MTLERSKMDKIAIEVVCRDSVADSFGRLRRRLSDCAPYRVQFCLHFGREPSYVLVNTRWGFCLIYAVTYTRPQRELSVALNVPMSGVRVRSTETSARLVG